MEKINEIAPKILEQKNLQKLQDNLPQKIETITTLEREQLKSLQAPRINKLTETQLKDLCVKIITYAYSLINQKPKGNNEAQIKTSIMQIAAILYNSISQYSQLTSKELKLAVRLGMTGELIDHSKLTMPLVSVANMLRFFSIYSENQHRDAVRKKNILQDKQVDIFEEQKKEKQKEKFENDFKNDIKKCYEDAAHINNIDDFIKCVYYDYCTQHLDVCIDNEFKISVWSEFSEKMLPYEMLSRAQKYYEGSKARYERKRLFFLKTKSKCKVFEYIIENRLIKI